jgi:hypothetical protein
MALARGSLATSLLTHAAYAATVACTDDRLRRVAGPSWAPGSRTDDPPLERLVRASS